MEFIIATNNLHKIDELKRMLKPLKIDLISAKEAGMNLDEFEETGKTFAENAFLKAKASLDFTGMPSIADDSGLMVDALNGEPGVYSARYAGEGVSDEERIEKLLFNLSNVNADNRTAHFRCAICCLFPNGDVIQVEGNCDGSIALRPKGDNGFGYDPVFLTESGKTFAELSDYEKDKISHRGNALRAFLERLVEKMSNDYGR